MDYLLIISGLLLLFMGGEALIRGSVTISKHLGISNILIGVVVVGFGTSSPELLVSIKASLNGQPDIATGNVVGSNIANILFILALSSIINPVICKDKAIHRDALIVFIASSILLGFAYLGIISQLSGIIMLITLIIYLTYSYKAEQKDKLTTSEIIIHTIHENEVDEFKSNMSLGLSVLISIAGISLLVFGANFLVQGATNIARSFNVSEAVIGLSLVAVGTSLPELATAISASIKKKSDIIIGSILGSNLFNILSILSITSIIKPIPITGQIVKFDIPFNLIIATISLLIIYLLRKFSRFMGFMFLGIYISYIIFIYIFT